MIDTKNNCIVRSLKITAEFSNFYINWFSATHGLVAFTIKTRAVDVDESRVYQELLCFSSNSQRNWPSVEKVHVILRLNNLKNILLKAYQPSLYPSFVNAIYFSSIYK